jgi:hypothetical protein
MELERPRSPEYVWFLVALGETWKVNVMHGSLVSSCDVFPHFFLILGTCYVMMTRGTCYVKFSFLCT